MAGTSIRRWGEEGSGSFLKELFPVCTRLSRERRVQTDKVFLLLFVHKKKILS
jgi:hypothetical protein